MKKLLLVLVFSTTCAHAEFKLLRDDVGKSSVTSVNEIDIPISTSPSFIRSITLSGVSAATVTIKDCQLFTANVSTKAQYYWPGGLNPPVTLPVGVMNSSGTMTHVIADAPGFFQLNYNWDWELRPTYANPLNERN